MKKNIFFILAICTFLSSFTLGQVNQQYLIPVVIVKYFPEKDGALDKGITIDVGGSLQFIRQKTDSVTQVVINSLEEGSRYHGYKDSLSKPSLKYKIIQTYEFLEPLPTVKKDYKEVPMTDYISIMERIDAKNGLKKKALRKSGFGDDGGVIGLWESNMASPFGDISNSYRDLETFVWTNLILFIITTIREAPQRLLKIIFIKLKQFLILLTEEIQLLKINGMNYYSGENCWKRCISSYNK